MDYELITDQDGNEFVVIDNGNGNFTSMTKAYWDELEAAKEAQLEPAPKPAKKAPAQDDEALA